MHQRDATLLDCLVNALVPNLHDSPGPCRPVYAFRSQPFGFDKWVFVSFVWIIKAHFANTFSNVSEAEPEVFVVYS